MKAMKLVMMAVVAVFMGTTLLTSCLDSGDSRPWHQSMVDVEDYYGLGYLLTTENGLKLEPVNGSNYFDLKLNDEKITVRRAFVQFYTVDDVPIEEGVTNYKIELFNSFFFDYKPLQREPVEAKSPFTAVQLFAYSNKYIDILAGFLYNKLDLNNYQAFVEKAENETIYINLVSKEEIEKMSDAKSDGLYFSIPCPTKAFIQSTFPEFEIPSNDEVTIKVIVKGVKIEGGSTYEDKEMVTDQPIKIKLR